MKKILGISVAIILLIFIIIIGINMLKGNNMTKAEVQQIKNEEDIVFKVISADKKFLTYSIVNNTNKDVVYGADYEIEKYVDGVWYKYNIIIDFIEIACIIEPGKVETDDIVHSTAYNLEKGKYRLIKNINSAKNYAEFEIQ